MQLRTSKITVNVPKLKLPKQEHRVVPDSLPSIDNGGFIGGIIGSRGSSKTTKMVELLLMYDKTESFDYVIIFSPTFNADPKYKYLEDNLHYANIDTYHDFDTATFHDLKEQIQKRLDEYKKYENYKKVYNKFMKYKGKSLKNFPQYDLMLLYEHDFEEPQTKYKNGVPTTLMVFDDLNYCRELYSNSNTGKNDVKRTMILHRHIKTSMLFLCQTYHNGIPKAIRNNLSLLILFKNKSPQMVKDISMELSSHISPDKFAELFQNATQEPYSFFMIDYDAPKELKFRKNWNELYNLED